MLQTDFSVVLPAVARLVSDAGTLQDLVSPLAETLRDVIPFERMHVLRLERADSVVLYTARASGELEVVGHRIRDHELTAGAADERGVGAFGAGHKIDPDAQAVMICPL